jgi:hypothetical protein
MWLITTFIAALTATLLWFLLKKKYQLGLLSLMLWGATIMILVDHLLGYKGGKFLETETDGIIKNGILLGIVMLLPIFFVWFIAISRSICNK